MLSPVSRSPCVGSLSSSTCGCTARSSTRTTRKSTARGQSSLTPPRPAEAGSLSSTRCFKMCGFSTTSNRVHIMQSRRQFVRQGLAGMATLACASSSWASKTKGRPGSKLVIALAYGGWDTMWAFDPKPDNAEIDQVPGDVRMFGDLPIWAHDSRPNVTTFFEQWASRTAVVNGIAVESLAHESCVEVLLTGELAAQRPDLAARVAAELGTERPLPYLALSAQAKTHPLESHTGILGDSNQLMPLSAPALQWPAPGGINPDLGLQLGASEREQLRAYLDAAAEKYAQEMGGSPRSDKMLRDYQTALAHAEQLRESARQGGMLSDADLYQDFSGPWRHVAAALGEGIAQVALVQPNLFWDTHSRNSDQGGAFEEFFGGLNTLMADLSSGGIMEDTTILVLSEMGRTPLHNSQAGKDHWPWTSAMVIGANVNGGRAFGETDSWLRPASLDLNTGEPTVDGEALHAEHVLHAAANLVGLDASDWFTREAFHALLG
ncbi:MAG: DUF1501 domain-containing protein [Myxococcales bacterium FL481]|nr:MAG: DUF1501 domain-containing protein [Myxococcales bacterium FL481]